VTPPHRLTPPAPTTQEIEIEENGDRVWVQLGAEKKETHLSPQEMRLFQHLLAHRGSVCTKQSLIDAGWPEDNGQGVTDGALSRAIERVRNRLPWLKIETVRSLGFKLLTAEEVAQ
jgi:DNA-binding response OmpR family regulator